MNASILKMMVSISILLFFQFQSQASSPKEVFIKANPNSSILDILQHFKRVGPKSYTEAQRKEDRLNGVFGFPQTKVKPFDSSIDVLLKLQDEDLVPYTNPTLQEGLTHLEGDETENEETFTITEGLVMVDSNNDAPDTIMFDKSQPTVIYVHGWTQAGITEPFFFSSRWEGHNRFLFRWHRDALDSGVLGAFPDDAEDRIWALDDEDSEDSIDDDQLMLTRGLAGEKFLRIFKKLLMLIGEDYDQEIRIIGHSLGSQVATYMLYSLAIENEYYDGNYLIPQRLELLDTYIGGIFGSRSIPEHSPLIQPPDFDQENWDRSYMKNIQDMVRYLGEEVGISIISYSGVTSYWFAHDLWKVSNFQEMSGAWLGRTHVINQHKKMRSMYFRSVNEDRRPLLKPSEDGPLPPFDTGPYAYSAQTPTDDIPDYTSYTKSVHSTDDDDYQEYIDADVEDYGINTYPLHDDVFYLVERE